MESMNIFSNKMGETDLTATRELEVSKVLVPQVLEIIERPQQFEDGLIEYEIGSGKFQLPLPKYKHGSSGVRFSLTQATGQEMPDFIWIQGSKMCINITEESQVGAFSFNLTAEDP